MHAPMRVVPSAMFDKGIRNMDTAKKDAKRQARIIELKLAIQKHGIATSTDKIWAVIRRNANSDGAAYALAAEYLAGTRPLTDLMIKVTQ
jgi:hypothetical protein